MKRLSMIAMLAAAVAFAACKKSENKPAPPAAGTAAAPSASPPPSAPGGAGAAAAAVAPGTGAGGTPAAGSVAGAPAPSAPTMSDADFDAMMAKGVAMINALARAVEGGAGDCAKIASGMNLVMDENKDFLEMSKKAKADAAIAAKAKAWADQHMSEMMGPMMTVAQSSQKCTSDAAYMAAIQRLQAL